MFTQACFIKNYNRDLISKIENIGYRNYGNPFQFTDYSILYTTIDGYYVPYKVQVDSNLKELHCYWLADKIYNLVNEEDQAIESLKIVINKLNKQQK